MATAVLQAMLREIVKYVIQRDKRRGARQGGQEVILEETREALGVSVARAVRRDASIGGIVCEMVADQAEGRGVADGVEQTYSSTGTLGRAWRDESGMTFVAWRSGAGMLVGDGLLGGGFAGGVGAGRVSELSASVYRTMVRRTKGWLPTRGADARGRHVFDGGETGRGEVVDGNGFEVRRGAEGRVVTGRDMWRHADLFRFI